MPGDCIGELIILGLSLSVLNANLMNLNIVRCAMKPVTRKNESYHYRTYPFRRLEDSG